MQGVRPKVQDFQPNVPSTLKGKSRIQLADRYGNNANKSVLELQPVIFLLLVNLNSSVTVNSVLELKKIHIMLISQQKKS